jgi:hypothetical protein
MLFVLAAVGTALIIMLVIGMVLGTDSHTDDPGQRPNGPMRGAPSSRATGTSL